jgi:hypothetical protein
MSLQPIQNRNRNKNKNKKRWTSEEESALITGHIKHGASRWKEIASDESLFDDGRCFNVRERNNVDLKDKWRNMEKKKKRKDGGGGGGGGGGDDNDDDDDEATGARRDVQISGKENAISQQQPPSNSTESEGWMNFDWNGEMYEGKVASVNSDYVKVQWKGERAGVTNYPTSQFLKDNPQSHKDLRIKKWTAHFERPPEKRSRPKTRNTSSDGGSRRNKINTKRHPTVGGDDVHDDESFEGEVEELDEEQDEGQGQVDGDDCKADADSEGVPSTNQEETRPLDSKKNARYRPFPLPSPYVAPVRGSANRDDKKVKRERETRF